MTNIPQELIDLGFVQELNRLFLNPMGVSMSGNGTISVIPRHDEPTTGHTLDVVDEQLAKRFEAFRRRRLRSRKQFYGWTVQPLPVRCPEGDA